MYNSIYPAYIRPYQGIQQKPITKKEEDEKSSQSSHQAERESQQENQRSNGANYFPNGEKVAIDYTRRKIGIEQVLSDFRNTANAIGAPDEIKAEVSSYLNLIENQAQKEHPNSQIIQANLKSASQILDEYITNTLKKPSKVVENWVDTLFLQQIDYKAQVKAIPEAEEAEIPMPQSEIVEDESALTYNQTPVNAPLADEIYIPSDPQLKRMFIQAKKYSQINQKEKALESFQRVMEYARDIGDEKACAIIHYEQGRIYDDFDEVEEALYNYDRAAQTSNDYNIKAKSHMYMGKIYDDYVRLTPAVDHYCAAVSFSGESDNLKLQSQALANLAQIHAEKYDTDNALMFMDLSDIAADETKDAKVKTIISAKNARNSSKIDQNARAMKYYSLASKGYSDIGDSENLAKNYLEAAKIMLAYGNKAKAKNLLSKAYSAAVNTGNSALKYEIMQQSSLI